MASKRTTKASTTIGLYLNIDTKKMMKEAADTWVRRTEDVRGLFILDVAKFMRDEVQKSQVEINIAGEEKKYADDLGIAIIDSDYDKDVVAIYLDGTDSVISQEYAEKNVLYFVPHDGSPRWVSVLAKYGPWPGGMVPVDVSSTRSKIISRRARKDEIVAISDRIMGSSSDIEQELARAGADNPRIGNTEHGIGLTVHEDIGYNVLRREFGMDGQREEAHWRPAIKNTKEYAGTIGMAKVVKYIETGDKKIFDLPEKTDKISASVLKKGSGFEKELEPFTRS